VYTLDTNTIIYYLKAEPAAVSVLEPLLAQDVALNISTITELELFSFSALSDADISAISQLLDSLVIVPLDSRVARFSGYLRRVYRLKTADSAIAATALLAHTTLVTRNVRDFQHIPNLMLMPI
jgi:predicted nucleic acid-binding protein